MRSAPLIACSAPTLALLGHLRHLAAALGAAAALLSTGQHLLVAVGQYNQRYGTFIDRGSLQPGDIVFFANTYKRGLSHVGIYVGGGMVVQALAPGTPLAAVSMNSAYWNSKYYGALRPNL